VKRYYADRAPDAGKGTHHVRMFLNPINRAYQPIILERLNEAEVRVVAEFVSVLRG
jgi:hypothetical protein